MTDLRTRLAETLRERQSAGVMGVVDLADAVLAVLGSPTDADVERVALVLCRITWPGNDNWQPYTTDARAAIRALVGEAGG